MRLYKVKSKTRSYIAFLTRGGESFENRSKHFFLYRNSSVLVIEFRTNSIQKVGSMKGNEIFSSRFEIVVSTLKLLLDDQTAQVS